MLVDGKRIASKIYEEVEGAVRGSKIGIIHGGEEDAKIYAGVIRRNGKALGVEVFEKCIPPNLEYFGKALSELNHCDGIIVAGLKHIPPEKIYSLIPKEKDIEGLSPAHLGHLYLSSSSPYPIPCTPAAVLRIIEETGYGIEGKDVCIINHSHVIGKPLATMLLQCNATVSVCHAFTRNLLHYTQNADVVIVGVGIPRFLKRDMVKEESFVIDCGMNRVNGKVVGDVEPSVAEKCSYFTPVPGGVGPLTTAMLFSNLAKLKKLHSAKA